jgi:hypothetical protein
LLSFTLVSILDLIISILCSFCILKKNLRTRMFVRRSVLAALVLLYGGAVSASSSSAPSKISPLVFRRNVVDLNTSASTAGRAGVAPTKVVSAPEPKTIPMGLAVMGGVVLAFNSGFANGCCLSGAIVEGTKQAVAAVTGAYTTSAVAFCRGDSSVFRTQMTMILSYAFGSCLAGVANPEPKPFVLSKSVGPTLLLCAALVGLSSNVATSGGGGASTLYVFALAAMANGIQNSITSVATGNLIRSAHYSGMTSDMGTFLGQMLRGNYANLFRFKVCMSLAAAFWTGGALSVFVTKEFGTSSLLFSAILYAICGLGVLTLQ